MRFSFSTSFSRLTYILLVLLIAFLLLISCFFLLSQAIRTSPNETVNRNANVVVIGAAYVLVAVVSVGFCLKRRLSVRMRLSRIPRRRIAIGKGDVPKAVHLLIEEELLRCCAIAYSALPKPAQHAGWGTPGTMYEGIRFRTAILDTVPQIDSAARKVIPSLSELNPHASLSRHLRHIVPLVSADENGAEYFATYTEAVERARFASAELTQEEFEAAMDAHAAICEILEVYYRALGEP